VIGGYGQNNDIAQTASLVAALVAAVLIIIILVVLAVILYKRKRLYGGFYILSIPPSPDYFKKLDPTQPISDQTNKLPYFPEWEYPRNKIKLSKLHLFNYVFSFNFYQLSVYCFLKVFKSS